MNDDLQHYGNPPVSDFDTLIKYYIDHLSINNRYTETPTPTPTEEVSVDGLDNQALSRLGIISDENENDDYDEGWDEGWDAEDEDEDYDEGWDAILDNENDGWTSVPTRGETNLGGETRFNGLDGSNIFIDEISTGNNIMNNITTVDDITTITGSVVMDTLELGGVNVLNIINDMSRMLDKTQNEIYTLEMESVNTTAEHYRLVEIINSMEERLRRLEGNG